MKDKVKGFFYIALLITLLLLLITPILGVLGSITLTNGCLLRYNGTAYTDVLSHSVTLNATGNYQQTDDSVSGKITYGAALDPSSYGQWVNTGINVTAGQNITLVVSSGSVSLCQAFLPAYNPEQNTAPGTVSPYRAGGDINPVTRAPIPIPRVGDTNFLSITLDAKNGNWFNVAKIDQYDQVAVSLQPSKKAIYSNGNLISGVTGLSYSSSITGATTAAIDCSEGRNSYHPLCGVYSISGTYGTGCESGNYYRDRNCCCNSVCSDRRDSCCPTSKYWLGNTTLYPVKQRSPYSSSGATANIIPYSTNVENLTNYGNYPLCNISNSINGGDNCNNDKPPASRRPTGNNGNFCYTYCTANPSATGCANNTPFPYPLPASPAFWFRADDGTGLLYRFDRSLNPTNQALLGPAASGGCRPDSSGYCFSPQPSGASNNILTFASSSATSQYLQFRLLDQDGQYADNTGGYVINIQQTKCQRTAGSYATDSYPNRGQIQYVIVPDDGSASAPTNSATGGTTGTGLTFDASNRTVLTPSATGTLWMLIANNFNDYQYSIGQYNISVQQKVAISQFGKDVLAPLLALVRGKIDSAGKAVFKNMTCYQTNTSSCTNFFNYIRGLLTLYITVFGLMYLAGMTEITTQDLVVRVIKIAIVAGLMNGGTYDFFNQYVFDLAIGFSDQIISNLAGYNLYSEGGAVNPLMFASPLMTKILFSKTTFAQILALLSFGISGVFFFLMVVMAIIMIVCSILRSFFVYIMAFVAIAFLLSLAPLFLTFMLFEKTYPLFENWTRAIFRFMIEPIILFAGIIILTQLAEIYIDNVLGWSVCWKCSLSFSLPFPSFPLAPAFMSQPLFCINWFAPWGYDYRSSLMGLAMQDIVGLGMIAFCAYGYGDFAEKMTQRITNSIGAPSASGVASNFTKSVSGYDPRTGDNKFEQAFKGGVGKARGAVGGAVTKLVTSPAARSAAGAAMKGKAAELGEKAAGAANKIQNIIKNGRK